MSTSVLAAAFSRNSIRAGGLYAFLLLVGLLSACNGITPSTDNPSNPTNPITNPTTPDPSPAPDPGPAPNPDAPDQPTPPPPVTNPSPASYSGMWSDPHTWPSGQLPKAGEAVTIPVGWDVTLDTDTPALEGLTIMGNLRFANRDLKLTSRWIMVHGRLDIGSTTQPYRNRAVITLTGNNPTENVMGMGTKVLGVMSGGFAEIHGEQRNGWTKLAATATRGSSDISVVDATGWRVGDQIVLASTDYDTRQAEVRTITAVAGNRLTLDKPLGYMHFGQITFDVDERGEVGLLTRNITIQGDASSTQNGFGGHMMTMRGGWTRVSGVEFSRMGQQGLVGRYPIHWHLAGDVNGQYVRLSSIHDTFNRCVTIHGTNRLLVSDNVGYNSTGHCFFFEDGAEVKNTVARNLGVSAMRPPSGKQILPSDSMPADFWITNPDNVIRNNAAAGSFGFGFWYAMPQNPTGLSKNATNDQTIFPRRTPLGEFSGNVAHSNNESGLMMGLGVSASGQPENMYYDPRSNPAVPTSSPVPATFSNFTSFKNRAHGGWFSGQNHKLIGARLADNAVGVTFAYNDSSLEDSVVVGESANAGQAEKGELVAPDGRTLPRPWDTTTAAAPVFGFQYYSGLIGSKNVRFINFQPNSLRHEAAITYQQFTNYSIDTRNYVQGAKFENALPAYWIPKSEPTADELSRGASADAYRGSLFIDQDGSVTGQAGRAVVINLPFLTNSRCTAKTDWNAYICDNPYGLLFIGNVSRERNFAPVTLTRTDSGANFRLWGTPTTGYPARFGATAISQQSYTLSLTGGPTNYFQIYLRYRKPGDWVQLSIPLSYAPHVYNSESVRNGNSGRNGDWGTKIFSVASLAALTSSTQTAYFYDGSTLNVRLVANATNYQDGAYISICRNDRCQ